MTDLRRELPNPHAVLQTDLSRQPKDPPPAGGSFYWLGGNPHDATWLSTWKSTWKSTWPSTARTPSCSADEESIALCWSGTFAEDLFAGDMRNWTKSGHAAFEGWLDETLPQLCDVQPKSGHGIRLLGVVPHHTHLLSDVAGQMRLWQSRKDQGLATVLYPSGLIAPSMAKDIDDHLLRSIANLGPRCSLCILEDLASPVGSQDEQHFQRVPWGTGMLPHALIERLLSEHLPATTPVIIVTDPPFFR